jgi:hypothetical protein
MMRDLIVGVIMDILRKVRIKILELLGVDRIPAAAGDLSILDPAKFVILEPEVGFQELNRRREPQQGPPIRIRIDTS